MLQSSMQKKPQIIAAKLHSVFTPQLLLQIIMFLGAMVAMRLVTLFG